MRESEIPARAVIGLTKVEIHQSLGKEEDCGGWWWMDPRATNARSCECYRFYRLPKNWTGGGPTLFIYYDKQDRSMDAAWMVEE